MPQALILALAFVAAGALVVPCHWIPLALDPEFTGWVAPVAARFADGMRLYADGGHSPLPPLSFVVAYLVGIGHPIWWHESISNYVCQCIAVVFVYLSAGRILPRWPALLVALGTFGIFLGIGKSLLYDSLTQAAVGCVGYAMLRWSESREARWALLAGVVAALAVLTKHNTGGAALAGAALVTLARRDIRGLVMVGFAAATTAAVTLVAMAPLVDTPGMWSDVVRHGSEPKGGTATLIANLWAYRDQLLGWPSEPVAMRLALFGLMGCGALTLARKGPPVAHRIGVLALVWMPAALGHSLSTMFLRWTYDNNPLIGAALTLMVAGALATRRRSGNVAAVALIAWLCWPTVEALRARSVYCTEAWPEIPAATGAYFPATAAPLRALIAEIHRHAAPGDAVLLLPEDPDFAAMIGQPRPRVSSAILYMDQYWDAWVPSDVERLTADPPKVIVLTSNAMRFAQTFYGGQGHRTHALAIELERALIPTRYVALGERHYRRYDGREDTLLLYVRR